MGLYKYQIFPQYYQLFLEFIYNQHMPILIQVLVTGYFTTSRDFHLNLGVFQSIFFSLKILILLNEKNKFTVMYRLPIFSLILVLFFTINIQSAYAYLDPGTGSIIFQALIGALAGFLITLKIFWHKIKERLLRKKQ